ncbi:MAG: type III-A CRISPR-associated RAMP protein Csm3 [Methanosarcinales archaeon]
MRLVNHKIIKGKIECITGLHIGGSAETIEIGGMDNPIIKNPLTGMPYVPGSSIKGKMRSLLELKYDMIYDNPDNKKFGEVHEYKGKNCGLDKCIICRIFGTSADEATFGPNRLIVRDAYLTEESRIELEKMKKEKGLLYAEEKTENRINRITAKATPRQIERVPAGINFNFELVFRVFDTDTDSQELLNYVKEGIELIEMDALGGSGSRGYGKVKFNIKNGEEAWRI